jgi:hypothetical protein
MALHNLFFSIWYHNMLQSGNSNSTGLLIYLRSFIDTLYFGKRFLKQQHCICTLLYFKEKHSHHKLNPNKTEFKIS